MSSNPEFARHGPQVVVVGNHKGGSGKSTVAMHVIIALLKAGAQVASFDLDLQQQSLSHYVRNRREWARRTGLALELPNHCPLAELAGTDGNEIRVLSTFTDALARLNRANDFVVIDTPSGNQHLSLLAHAMADTLITPVNDSFVDLDVIVSIDAAGEGPPKPSRYVGTVEQALEGRRSIGRAPFDWVVIRNRLSPVVSRHERQISEVLDYMAPRLGFRTLRGLTERLVFRELFPFGLTAFDQVDEKGLSGEPSMAHLLARMEVGALLEQIGLLPGQPADGAIDESIAPGLPLVDRLPSENV